MEIELTQGKVAQIDPDDWPLVAGYRWFATRDRNTWYATAHGPEGTIRMHRLILGAKRGEKVDHRDGDGLMNRRSNLRRASTSQNGQNRRAGAKNKSGYKGVSWSTTAGKWRANIKSDGRHVHLGYFIDAADAALAYDTAAIRHFGEFARLNFPRAA